MQEGMVRLRREERIPDTLLLLEHPHVITHGSSAKKEHVLVDDGERARLGIEQFETGRGGDVTYHGPGQLIGYPILALRDEERDAHRYLRSLEELLIRTLAGYGLEARRHDEHTGVWVGPAEVPAKIAAIGVRLSHWITSHGFALNVSTELSYFETIVPCGIENLGVTSLQQELGTIPAMDEVEDRLIEQFGIVFERDMSEQRMQE
jgi:lipoyl(octanoyl) transferase